MAFEGTRGELGEKAKEPVVLGKVVLLSRGGCWICRELGVLGGGGLGELHEIRHGM